MLDLFMLAVMALCALLGPSDAERFAIDVYDAKSGKVQTLVVTRTPGGVELASSGSRKVVKISALGEGRYSVQPGRERPREFDLGPALSVLKGQSAVQVVQLEMGEVRVSRSAGLTYVAPISREGAPLFVIRALRGKAPAPAPPSSATKPGIGELAGWEEYETPWEVRSARLPASGAQSSPAAVAARFFASLMRGDEDYLEILSPRLKPELREKLRIKERARGLKRVVGRARASKSSALALKGPWVKLPQVLQETFGDYEVLLLCQGNTSREDMLLAFEQVEGKWYLKGVLDAPR